MCISWLYIGSILLDFYYYKNYFYYFVRDTIRARFVGIKTTTTRAMITTLFEQVFFLKKKKKKVKKMSETKRSIDEVSINLVCKK